MKRLGDLLIQALLLALTVALLVTPILLGWLGHQLEAIRHQLEAIRHQLALITTLLEALRRLLP